MIDQMRGGLDHSSCAARGADATLLAGERDEQSVPAAIALHADEAVFQSTAREVASKLVEDEPRQWSFAFGEPALEARQVLLDEGVENRVLGAMACVARTERTDGRW
jgi:hypothetical protein